MKKLLIAAACAALLGAPASEATTIDNGLAPPNPANVIDASDVVFAPLIVRNATTVALVAGGVVGGSFEVHDTSSILMSGGTSGQLESYDTSTIALSGGTVSGDLEATGSSSVAVTGGSIAGTIFAANSSVVTIFGSGFAVDGSPVPFGLVAADTGTLTGTLASGEAMSTLFAHQNFGGVTGTIVLAVPEPSLTLLLASGLVGLGVRRRRHLLLRAQRED